MGQRDLCVIDAEFAYVILEVMRTANQQGRTKVDLGFRCVGCRWPVKPVKAASGPPYFEHIHPNPNCSLTYEQRQTDSSPRGSSAHHE